MRKDVPVTETILKFMAHPSFVTVSELFVDTFNRYPKRNTRISGSVGRRRRIQLSRRIRVYMVASRRRRVRMHLLCFKEEFHLVRLSARDPRTVCSPMRKQRQKRRQKRKWLTIAPGTQQRRF